jgi:hypothetical protein
MIVPFEIGRSYPVASGLSVAERFDRNQKTGKRNLPYKRTAFFHRLPHRGPATKGIAPISMWILFRTLATFMQTVYRLQLTQRSAQVCWSSSGDLLATTACMSRSGGMQ